jgi:hypothetical protein
MLYSFLITSVFFPHCLVHPLFLQNLNLSEHLAFDPASIESAILEANDPPLDSTSTANRLLHMKNLLSGLIDALIQDSSAVKQILDEVNFQLPVSLQVKLLPAGYLLFEQRWQRLAIGLRLGALNRS